MSDSNFSAIRASLRYASIEEFIDGYSRFISAGGMFIPMAPNKLKPNGTTVRFQFLLKDGSTALLGEGVVVQVRPPDPANPAAPVGMLIKFSKLSQESKNLVDQIVAMKEFSTLGGVEVVGADADAGDETPEQEETAQAQASVEEAVEEPEPEASASETSEASHGPRKLAQTEGGLQILAFDEVSAEQAGDLAFDIGAEESDVDEMFAGLFGGGDDGGDDVFGGMFGGGVEPEAPAEPEAEEPVEAPAEAPEAELAEESSEEALELVADAPEEAAPAEEEAQGDEFEEESYDAPAQEEEPAFEEEEPSDDEEEPAFEAAEAHLPEPEDSEGDAQPSFEEEQEEEPQVADEEPLPGYENGDDGPGLSFPSDWEQDEPEPAEQAPAEEEPASFEASSDEGAQDSEAESLDLESDGVVLIEGSEADLIEEEQDVADSGPGFDSFDEFGEEEEPVPPAPPAEEEVDEGPSELEDLLGNLESDPREDRDMSLHLANDPLAAFADDEAAQDAPAAEDDEESLDFLLAVAKSEIASKHADEPADKSGDILDSLLGDVADLPPPPPDAPLFTAPPPKKKKGFLSKLFGDD